MILRDSSVFSWLHFSRYHLSVRALLVEDDATIADFVVRGLREAGFAVDHAADGEAGLKSAAESP